MARKTRDYKAEYAAAKRRATRAGYKSEREYKRVRKELALPPRTMPVPKRILEANPITALRRQSQAWSDAHSKRKNSRYRPSMPDAQVVKYHAAFVEADISDAAKVARIKRYLVPDLMTEDEYDVNPSTVPLRR